MIDVHKVTTTHLIVNVTSNFNLETLEVIAILATNIDVRKFIMINGEPFNFDKLTEMAKAKSVAM